MLLKLQENPQSFQLDIYHPSNHVTAVQVVLFWDRKIIESSALLSFVSLLFLICFHIIKILILPLKE